MYLPRLLRLLAAVAAPWIFLAFYAFDVFEEYQTDILHSVSLGIRLITFEGPLSICLFVCLLHENVQPWVCRGGLGLAFRLEAEAGSLGSAAGLCSRWRALELLGNCSASAFCLTVGVRGLQMCAISSGSLCGSERQIRVLSHQATYLPSRCCFSKDQAGW